MCWERWRHQGTVHSAWMAAQRRIAACFPHKLPLLSLRLALRPLHAFVALLHLSAGGLRRDGPDPVELWCAAWAAVGWLRWAGWAAAVGPNVTEARTGEDRALSANTAATAAVQRRGTALSGIVFETMCCAMLRPR